MPNDDSMLGQNEVDVRNEARNPLNAMPPRYAPIHVCMSEDLHPYECDGPGKCRHCDEERRAEAKREAASPDKEK